MKKRWFVIDHEGNPSYSSKKEAPEHFSTATAAAKRARELASYAPGETIYIAEAVTAVTYPVGNARSVKL